MNLSNSDLSLKIDGPESLESIFKTMIRSFIDEHGFTVQDMAIKKLEAETQLYFDKYRLDKIYENVVKI